MLEELNKYKYVKKSKSELESDRKEILVRIDELVKENNNVNTKI